ncbi:hypothetical protein [Kitasatospora sp. CB01950]|uniref:hypothetical protein n=1 Tax=Kitasatospora sp. CB01950 TaxID=1703930 RepID=UPI0013012455|nr:hypothetical protein [Kitasatospora sp. CB01950]
MTTDRTPENDSAEAEAVLSLQETETGKEVEAHEASTWTIGCNITVTKTIRTES